MQKFQAALCLSPAQKILQASFLYTALCGSSFMCPANRITLSHHLVYCALVWLSWAYTQIILWVQSKIRSWDLGCSNVLQGWVSTCGAWGNLHTHLEEVRSRPVMLPLSTNAPPGTLKRNYTTDQHLALISREMPNSYWVPRTWRCYSVYIKNLS